MRTPRTSRALATSDATAAGVKRALIALLVLFLLLVGGAAAFVGYLAYTVNDNVTHADLLPENRPPITAPDGTKVAETGTGTNFLVMGADTRPGDAGRSDVIVLVHIPADGETVNMIHFPRDLYVDIPGHGKDKINAAYAFGGEPLLVQTMENLLKIRIHHVAKTNFEGFENMTDAVGRRPRVRRGGEQHQRQRGSGRHQEGVERPQRCAGPGLRARAPHAQRGRHLPWAPPAGLHQGVDAQGDEHRDRHEPADDRQVHRGGDRRTSSSTRTSRSAS